jgi:hypothetical protein
MNKIPFAELFHSPQNPKIDRVKADAKILGLSDHLAPGNPCALIEPVNPAPPLLDLGSAPGELYPVPFPQGGDVFLWH